MAGFARTHVLALTIAVALFGCDNKADTAASGSAAASGKASAAKTSEMKKEPAMSSATAATTTTASAATPSGPGASDSKEFLGLELKPIGAWKPTWDADAKVAKWENEEYMSSIVNRVVTDKLDSVDDLKAAAPMMMQLGSAITKVDEEKKTDKGWYAVVTREEKTSDLVYVRKFGDSTVVCSANMAKGDMGKAITKAEAIKACESLELKK